MGVCLKQASTKTAKEINRQQFYPALFNCISVKLHFCQINGRLSQCACAVQCVQTLLTNTWSSVVSAEYGEMQLKKHVSCSYMQKKLSAETAALAKCYTVISTTSATYDTKVLDKVLQ